MNYGIEGAPSLSKVSKGERRPVAGRRTIKMFLRAAALAAGLTLCAAGVAQAQSAERVYDNGPVWVIS